MLAFPGMLIEPARKAEMACPNDPSIRMIEIDKEQYPHFYVFCCIQLGRSMTSWTEHWENAKIIAAIPREELVKLTMADLAKKGVRGLPDGTP